jgi:hypothetical protein
MFIAIDMLSVLLLVPALRARTSTPFYIKLSFAGTHIVKGLKQRHEVFIPHKNC